MKMSQSIRRVLAAAVTAALLGAIVPAATPAKAVTADKPNASNIYIYNGASAQTMVYILNSGTESGAVYRVYTASGALAGSASVAPHSNYCAVRLRARYKKGTRLSVTRQTADGAESGRVSVTCGEALDPSVQLNIHQVDDAQAIPQVAALSSSKTADVNAAVNAAVQAELGFETGAVQETATLTAGSYYQVEVRLRDFTALDSVTIPLRYDTAYLEPASITYDYKLTPITDTHLARAADGLTFNLPDSAATNYCYGFQEGLSLRKWCGVEYNASGVSYDTGAAAFSASTQNGSYQYINTTTGLIKLEAGPANPAAASNVQVVRLFFRARQDAALHGMPVWFATEADCPEAVKDSPSMRLKYYDPASPNGVQATLAGANVLSLPLVLEAVSTCDEAAPVRLASATSGLPGSYYAAVAKATGTTSTAIVNPIRVYNYTNYDPLNVGAGTLDQSKTDHLRIEPASGTDGAIKAGEIVRVYQLKGGAYEQISKDDACRFSTETGVDIDLQRNYLQPEGGEIYVSVVRSSGESEKVKVSYPKEVKRNVSFCICRSSWDAGHAAVPFDPKDSAGMWAGGNKVQLGEHLQLRVYFNNFYDLMSYGLAIHFDPRYVQVADASYNALTDGTVQEADYWEGGTCFTVGNDLADVTLTEQMVYHAKQRGDAGEIASLQAELGLTSDEFNQLASDVGVKYSMGVGGTGSTVPWKGGLLFTGTREDPATSFPYVDNTKGYLQFMSASLVKPPLTLETAADGYHFLSINFVVTAYGDPGFRLATAADDAGTGSYCRTIPTGAEVILAGGEDPMGVTTSWTVQAMGAGIEMRLAEGNALAEDQDETAVYLYAGEAYRDPGCIVTLPDGAAVDMARIKRYYFAPKAGGGEEMVLLPDYKADEALEHFSVRDGGYSDHYTLIYEYDGQTIERNVYVIYRKGDVNRDGAVDLFDEQALASHLSGVRLLVLEDDRYLAKTVDVNGDGGVGPEDRAAIRANSLGTGKITQAYKMPVP